VIPRHLLFCAFLCACGAHPEDDTPQGVETTLELNFTVVGNDADGDGTVIDIVSVNVSPDDPWTSFRDTINEDFGGMPSDITLEDATLSILDSSSGVTDLGDVFNGPVAYRIRMDGSGNTHSLAVADIRETSTATSIDNFALEFDYSTIGSNEQIQIIAGSIGIRFVGQGSDDFRRTSKRAELAATLTFRATPPMPSE
jgi:hypothetical protein